MSFEWENCSTVLPSASFLLAARERPNLILGSRFRFRFQYFRPSENRMMNILPRHLMNRLQFMLCTSRRLRIKKGPEQVSHEQIKFILKRFCPISLQYFFSNCLINFQLLCSAWISTFCRQIFFLNCCWCSDEQINVQLKKTNIIMNLSN